MKIIVNKDIPEIAVSTLMKYGEIISFSSTGITYDEISGHPDIFMCQIGNSLVTAPNIPTEFKKKLENNNLKFIEGNSIVGDKYPKTAAYNAVVTNNYLIHNLKITDSTITTLCSNKIAIHVNQAYTRCNLLPLENDRFITSDLGIYNTLKNNKLEVIMVNPEQIQLPGFSHGFFGGACGLLNNMVFVIGELINIPDGNKVHDFVMQNSHSIVELYNGKLFDAGSIFFVKD